MAKNRHQIELNYFQTLRQADALEELANQINAITSRELEDAMDRLAASWQGEDGSKYQQKGNRLNRLTATHGKTLQQVATILRRTAQNTYQAELLSIELAEKRWHL